MKPIRFNLTQTPKGVTLTFLHMKTYRIGLLVLLTLFAFAISGFAQTEGAAILARDEPATGGGGRVASATSGGSSTVKPKPGTAGKKATASAAKPAATRTTPAKPKPYDGFIVGDKYTFLNFEVVSAEKPYHTRDAKANGASGLVQVEVLINTNGSVLTAKARTGNKLLHPEAERAALASKFNQPKFGGKPARAIGFLVYRFGKDED